MGPIARPSVKGDFPPSARVLILHPGSLGDVMLALPALQALRRRFRKGRIHWIVQPALLRLFSGTNWYDSGTSLDAAPIAHLFSERPDLSALPFERPHAAVFWVKDPEGHLSRNLLRLGAGRVILDHPLSNPLARHRSELFMDSLLPLGVSPRPGEALRLCTEIREMGKKVLEKYDSPPSIILHPGAGAQRKRWPPSVYGRLADLLLARGRSVLLLEGPAEPGLAEGVARTMRRPVKIIRGLDLEAVSGLLAASGGFIGNDSGITHLAAALGISTLALFKASDPNLWAPLGENVRVETEEVRLEQAVLEQFSRSERLR